MISRMSACFLVFLIILYGLFTLSYNLVIIENQNGITKVLATSDDESGDSTENSEDVDDDISPDDTSQSSDEDGPSDPEIDCNADMILVDGECKEQSAADAAAKSNGDDAAAAAATGDLSGKSELFPAPADVLGTPDVDNVDVGTQHNEYSLPDSDKFHLNSEDIALELSSLTPVEIAEYPITDLSDNDLKLALSFLAPSDLAKVLKNIPIQDLVVVKERLGDSKFGEFLSKVSITDKEVLENALALA